ncbi:MAG: ornithine carbamoyltransferase [Candidatus Dormibacteraeota bacterium]|nr:ornithine carbamoyltransferase [Candidatus Dormibacteraeota bacterium]
MGLSGRDLLAVGDLSPEELLALLERAGELKQGADPGTPLARRSIALIFLRPSNRTRVSFEAAIARLGGHPIALFDREIEMGKRESVGDVGRILDRFVDGLVARIPSERDLRGLARAMRSPVVNAMTDLGHPCQILADCLTVREQVGHLAGARVTFVGDGNNVCNSWIECAQVGGIDLRVVTPSGYEPAAGVLQAAAQLPGMGGGRVLVTNDLEQGLAGTEVIYTDVWTSMGQEEQHEDRRQDFGPYQVNERVLERAPKGTRVMHCLPAHRGEEITDGVIDGPQSIVFEQAENRYWMQLALLAEIFGPTGAEG